MKTDGRDIDLGSIRAAVVIDAFCSLDDHATHFQKLDHLTIKYVCRCHGGSRRGSLISGAPMHLLAFKICWCCRNRGGGRFVGANGGFACNSVLRSQNPTTPKPKPVNLESLNFHIQALQPLKIQTTSTQAPCSRHPRPGSGWS